MYGGRNVLSVSQFLGVNGKSVFIWVGSSLDKMNGKEIGVRFILIQMEENVVRCTI